MSNRHQRAKCEAEWVRQTPHFVRSTFGDLPVLSPICESPNREKGYVHSDSSSSSLPDLIIEREQRTNRHDEPEEFYEQLAVRMRRFYRKLFHGDNYDDDSPDDLVSDLADNIDVDSRGLGSFSVDAESNSVTVVLVDISNEHEDSINRVEASYEIEKSFDESHKSKENAINSFGKVVDSSNIRESNEFEAGIAEECTSRQSNEVLADDSGNTLKPLHHEYDSAEEEGLHANSEDENEGENDANEISDDGQEFEDIDSPMSTNSVETFVNYSRELNITFDVDVHAENDAQNSVENNKSDKSDKGSSGRKSIVFPVSKHASQSEMADSTTTQKERENTHTAMDETECVDAFTEVIESDIQQHRVTNSSERAEYNLREQPATSNQNNCENYEETVDDLSLRVAGQDRTKVQKQLTIVPDSSPEEMRSYNPDKEDSFRLVAADHRGSDTPELFLKERDPIAIQEPAPEEHHSEILNSLMISPLEQRKRSGEAVFEPAKRFKDANIQTDDERSNREAEAQTDTADTQDVGVQCNEREGHTFKCYKEYSFIFN